MRNHLVVMTREAVAGRVKTRLARAIGVTEATRLHRVLLAETIRRLTNDRRWRLWTAITPDTAARPRRRVVAQGGGDLGRRMQRLIDRLPRGPVVIIGSDIPGIARADIALAFRLLGTHDVVLGRAPDGGYWLIGARRRPRIPRLFRAVRWSTPHALADTLAGLGGLRVGFAGQKGDIDSREDYERWLGTTRSSASISATVRCRQ